MLLSRAMAINLTHKVKMTEPKVFEFIVFTGLGNKEENMAREGERNGRAKLNWSLVKRLRKIYKKGKPFQKNRVSCLNLSLDHDVSPSTMWSMLAGKSWINQ